MNTSVFEWIIWTLLFHICRAETPYIIVSNITVPVGHEAVLTCTVENLGHHKVAWARLDSITPLTLHKNSIKHNARAHINTPEPRIWNLHIKNVRESDRGYYGCFVNTDPILTQSAYLEVLDSSKPDDTNATKLNENDKTDKRPDKDSSTDCCLPTSTTITLCFIFVLGTVLLYKILV